MGGPCLCLKDLPPTIAEDYTIPALLQRLLAAVQASKQHLKARGGVCRKAAVSNHPTEQLRSFTETARLLHRHDDAIGAALRAVMQVAMQL